MHAELARVDPITAARLPPNDSQRIQRALEVHRISGRPLSSFHSPKSIAADDHSTPGMPLISLEPTDRAWLHARIAQRFDAMLHAGLLDEVLRLRARGDLHADLPSMRCVGYRQAWELLDAHRPEGDAPFAVERNCANSASTPRASWPNAKSPGCAPCRLARSCPATSADAVAQVLRQVDALIARGPGS
jgi:tRNA dimethylallyltransferase